jgi:hypothetical protein
MFAGGSGTAQPEMEGAAEHSERMQLHALRVAVDLGFQGTDGAESVDGLDDFEDVLVRPLKPSSSHCSGLFQRLNSPKGLLS